MGVCAALSEVKVSIEFKKRFEIKKKFQLNEESFSWMKKSCGWMKKKFQLNEEKVSVEWRKSFSWMKKFSAEWRNNYVSMKKFHLNKEKLQNGWIIFMFHLKLNEEDSFKFCCFISRA